jgi:hypothetical protein
LARTICDPRLGRRCADYLRVVDAAVKQPEPLVAPHTDDQENVLAEAAPVSLTSADLIPDRALKRAEEDRFQHSALARRVAELARSVEPRINIALYGPWGSGKSSLAGLIEEALDGSGVGFVYYDAWKFGGKALRRNFVTNAASELGLPQGEAKYQRYYEGLYESRRRARFHPKSIRKALVTLAGSFVVLLGLFLVLVCGALAIASTFDQSNFIDQVKAHLPDYLGPGGGVTLVFALVTAAIVAGRIDVDQSAPSDDEEFSQRFRELIEDARKRSHSGNERRAIERIVFFIDELDRCDEKDVVQTLVAVRTFLGEERCVFVVAADRDVLETALQREVEQASPTDVVDPYYTTAGAFLDKIFGHQMEIPPIRGRRLTRFARDLVRAKGGLWQEIVDAGGQSGLDGVIYTLIPAHVRSPRRVKVLLNSFATNARVAEGRGIEWPDRAQEIAKLTALQIEFPTLARDLILEPRLPSLLLDPENPELSERARGLVERHRVDEGAPEEAEAPDRFLDRGETQDQELDIQVKAKQERHKEMVRRYRAQLLRYLERTARVRNPQRDLLYLEAAGLAVDLEDPELGELIEERAPEAPDEVVDEVRRRDPTEQLASVRLLADMVQDMIADEQASVMTAMMVLVSDLGGELSDRSAREVANSLRLFSRDKALAPEHLVGALAVALRVRDNELAGLVGSREELWADSDRVRGVALLTPLLPDNLKAELTTHIASLFASDPDVLIDPVSHLPEQHALELLQAAQVHDEVERFLADSTVDVEQRAATANDLLEAALDH